jgi:death-on-curing protein
MAGSGGELPYRTPFSRAAALAEGLALNHGFVDGNKRTAMYAMAFWLERESYRLETADEELVDIALKIAHKEVDIETVAMWLQERSAPV